MAKASQTDARIAAETRAASAPERATQPPLPGHSCLALGATSAGCGKPGLPPTLTIHLSRSTPKPWTQRQTSRIWQSSEMQKLRRGTNFTLIQRIEHTHTHTHTHTNFTSTQRIEYTHTETHRDATPPTPCRLISFPGLEKRITCPQRLGDEGQEVGPRLGSPAAEVREQTQDGSCSEQQLTAEWLGGLQRPSSSPLAFFFFFAFASLKG